jgi:hypothetical protein
MKSVMLGCVAGLLLAVCSSQVAAQPLAEVARLEKLRRQALAERTAPDGAPPKVYTASDLRGSGRLTTSALETSTAAAGTAADATSTTTGTEDAPTTDEGPTDEDQWRNRVAAVREARERARLMADALQNRVDGLWADYTTRDDPAQRTVIEQNRQEALAELENTTNQINDLSQQLADIAEEARRANVPPGWLR